MAGTSRIARLTSLIGGEHNMPPKLPRSSPAVEQSLLQEADAAPKVVAQDEWWHELLVVRMARPDSSPPPPPMPSPVWWHDLPVVMERHPEPLSRLDSHLYTDLHSDELAPNGMGFCPFTAVTKFCYLFAPSHLKQALATDFFDAGKIFQRDWHIFYIWSEYFVTAKPTTFVPESQVLELLREINRRYSEVHASISSALRGSGFVLDFDDSEHPNLRPRWLGRCNSKQQYEEQIARLTMPDPAEHQAGNRTLEAFKAKIDLANNIAKAKNKEAKAKRHAENLVKRQGMAGELRAAQTYLGLRKDSASARVGPNHVILIAIDVEAYERAPSVITEVGVATISTGDLKGEPGRVGQNWQNAIRSRHFRIDEHKHLVNKDFVIGCPDRFEFGTSEFVRKKELLTVLADCFRQPDSTGQHPSMVLVGHDIAQDIRYLKAIGFDALSFVDPAMVLDTTSMYRAHTHDPNARSLGSILYDFDLTGFNLHNAGNDATYTLWALLAVAVANAAEADSGAAAERHNESFMSRTDAAVQQARQRVQSEAEGWEL